MKLTIKNKYTIYCIAILFFAISFACAQSPVVRVTEGYIKGLKEGNSYVFKGIPYAKEPKGALRFKAPLPHEKWADTLNCTKFATVAPQKGHFSKEGNFLSLNVYSKDLNKKKLNPVVVWIHGGGMLVGSGQTYDGHAFSDNDSIVAVTIDYRLGVLGFLKLNDIGKQYATSGNNGILDCLAALKWVKNNIAEFGGDPDKVTIMGESAGAKLVSALVVTPLSKGLFDQAIMESGGVQCIHDPITPLIIRKKLFRELGITKAKDILTISTEELIKAQEKVTAGAQGTNYFGPVRDGIVYKEDPYCYIANNKLPKIRLLIGANKSEARFFMDLDKRLYRPTPEALADWFGDNGSIVYKAFKKQMTGNTDTSLIAISVLSQYMYNMHAFRMGKAFSEAGNPTWMYRFDYSKNKYGAKHTDELKYVWYLPTAEKQGDDINDTLAQQLHRDWVHFINRDNFFGSGGWSRYNIKDRIVKVYDVNSEAQRLSDIYDDKNFPSSAYILKAK
ncbi:carboxylesterase family protein [Sphingobacterium sp.]|uniref:carboxylesterase/lipase family protein n=1 Tax=Sphingobacterium sp. TaxID=341027 RepID=UPI0031D9F095